MWLLDNTMKLKDGSTYTGEINNKISKLQHGFGTQEYPDNSKYVGDWVEGKAVGQGVITYPNG